MKPTTDQVSGVLDRLVLAALMYAVGKGIIDQNLAFQLAPQIAAVLITLGGAGWGWWVNRPKAIVQSAAALPNTTVVTTPDLSNNTPESNIVSNVTNKVVTQPAQPPIPESQK